MKTQQWIFFLLCAFHVLILLRLKIDWSIYCAYDFKIILLLDLRSAYCCLYEQIVALLSGRGMRFHAGSIIERQLSEIYTVSLFKMASFVG